MLMPPMRLLVCGGAGYIGSHMCKLLASRGHQVAVLDNLSTGHREAVRWGTLYEGDIADDALLTRMFAEVQPEGVLHFAAKSVVGESVRDPSLYYLNNVTGSLALFEHVRKIPGCPLIFSSTAAIFGSPLSRLINEKHPKEPINPYGRTKLAIEQALQDYWAAYAMPSVSFRYFNAAGADPSGELGEAHEPETHLIPRVLQSVLGMGEPLRIFGEDYDTPDGTCIRDYVHVNDLCMAHLLGLHFLRVHRGAHAFNLGNGEGFSVRDVLRVASEVTGSTIDCEFTDRRPGDPSRLVADSAAARESLGWQPDFPDLAQIIASAWSWHKNRKF